MYFVSDFPLIIKEHTLPEPNTSELHRLPPIKAGGLCGFGGYSFVLMGSFIDEKG